MPLLEVKNLQMDYTNPEGVQIRVLDVHGFSMEAGSQVGMRGVSGSGKTTFLNVIAGLLSPSRGSVTLNGVNLTQLSGAERDAIRATQLGMVHQNFHLLHGYTCLENVLMGMTFGQRANTEVAIRLLRRVGLRDRLNYFPRQLSAGQQQRVAIARALAARPMLVLADEPTGSLDEVNSRVAVALLREVCEEEKAGLLLVSHDAAVLAPFDTCVDFRELNRATPAVDGGDV